MAKKVETVLSRLYEYWSSHIQEDEYLFYHRLLTACLKDGGKALELFCGSGRFLLSFAKEKMDVEGIEGSIELCNLLRKKAEELDVAVNVSQQRLESCQITGKYQLIYSALGSFQMLIDREDGKNLLFKAYSALEDNGVLSIALFLPYVGADFLQEIG